MTRKKYSYKIILAIVVIVAIALVFYFTFREGFSLTTGVKFPDIPGTVTQQPTGGWQFIPSSGYFGPAKLTYELHDGTKSYTNSIILNIKRTFDNIKPSTAAVNWNQLEINNTANPLPSGVSVSLVPNTDATPFSYSFSTKQLWDIIKPSDGEFDQNYDKVIITNLTQEIATNPPEIASGILSSSEIQIGMGTFPPAPYTSSPEISISSGILSLDDNTKIVYKVPSDYPASINVSITYYLIDSVNIVNGLAPAGPFTLSFIVPWAYHIPTIQPIIVSDVEGNTINLDFLKNITEPLGNINAGIKLALTGSPQVATCNPGEIMANSGQCFPIPRGFKQTASYLDSLVGKLYESNDGSMNGYDYCSGGNKNLACAGGVYYDSTTGDMSAINCSDVGGVMLNRSYKYVCATPSEKINNVELGCPTGYQPVNYPMVSALRSGNSCVKTSDGYYSNGMTQSNIYGDNNGTVSGDTYCAGSWGGYNGMDKNLKCVSGEKKISILGIESSLPVPCNIVNGLISNPAVEKLFYTCTP